MNDRREYRFAMDTIRTVVAVGVVFCCVLVTGTPAFAQSMRFGSAEHKHQFIYEPEESADTNFDVPEWASDDDANPELSSTLQKTSNGIQPLSFDGESGLYKNATTPVTGVPIAESLFRSEAEIVPQTASLQRTIPSQTVAYGQPVAPQWSLLPNDLMFRSFLGAPREPRFASQILHSSRYGTIWELEAGGRVGILRYGSPEGSKPEGWQLDLEGAAFPRLNFDESLELDAVDFKVGVPLTWAEGPYQFEVAIYHLSSHVGDEFLLRPGNEGFRRLDYLRDAITMGFGYFVNPDWRVYSEVEYAFNTNDGAEPWHFQFGVDYMPSNPRNPFKPVPFFAVNGQLREEVNFGGGVNVVAGIAWKGPNSGRIFRAGLQYYNGESFQLSFFDEHEQLIGAGLWYDF